MKTRGNLFQKISLSTCAVLSLLVLSTLVFLDARLKETISARTRQSLQDGRRTGSGFLNDRSELLLLNARVFVESPQFKSLLATPGVDRETLLFTLRELSQVAETDLLMVTDAVGKVLARLDKPDQSAEDLGQRPDIREALQGKEYAGFLVEGETLYQVLTLPAISEERLQGALSIGFAVDHDLAQRMREMTGCEVSFWADEAVVALSGGADQKDRLERRARSHPEILSIPADRRPLDPRRLEEGGRRSLLLTWPLEHGLGPQSLRVVLELSLSEALAFYERGIRFRLILIGIFLMALSLAASLWLAQSIASPILRLATAAGEIAKGNFSQKVRIESQDEVGILGESFNRMVVDLQKTRDDLLAAMDKQGTLMDALTRSVASEKQRAQELEKAQEELTIYSRELEQKVTQRTGELGQANENLTFRVDELKQRNREITLLSEMDDILQACMTADEAYTAVGRTVHQMFPAASGALSLMDSQKRDLLNVVVSWGEVSASQSVFTWAECMGLRRGRLHWVESPRLGIPCPHLPKESNVASMCVPMMGQGKAMGALHFVFPLGTVISDEQRQIAGTVTKHISLSLANLGLRETLREQSIRDTLTGLFNRRYMEETLHLEVARAIRSERPLGIIMLDVDHFKHCNDTYGHDGGDAVLREVGLFLKKQTREGDIACRFGGEEFVLILPATPLEECRQIAEQIREAVKKLEIRKNQQVMEPISVSLGVAVFPQHGRTAEFVLQTADEALYRSKEEGRDRVTVSGS